MSSKKQNVAVSTSKVMAYIEKESGIFDREHHQDCHEFYFWMMEKINDQLKECSKKKKLSEKSTTQLEEEFFSKRITRIQCHNCHTVTEREQEEVDFSLVLPQPNVSLNYCIDQYSVGEKLTGKNKFKCDKCQSHHDAQKKSLIKTLPNFLTIHLRRFKYDEAKKGITKLLWLIPFPFKIKMKPNYVGKEQNKIKVDEDLMYKLVGVVAHIGTGGNVGHYISYIKIDKQWYLFNDDEITEIDDFMLESLWGYKGITKCGYMLFYTL